jgi:tRNA(Ile)-lysidine synthase
VRIDAGSVTGELELRNWRPGDRFEPLGVRKSLKLKELFRRQKLALASRRLWPVLVSRGVVVWVSGMPAARSAAPGKDTKVVLVVREESLRTAHTKKD